MSWEGNMRPGLPVTDREALAAALSPGGLELRWPLDVVLAAARERLAQLPEKCGTCGGRGSEREIGPDCLTCHGKGFLYPPALVERIFNVLWIQPPHKMRYREWVEGVAVAVLDTVNTAPEGDAK